MKTKKKSSDKLQQPIRRDIERDKQAGRKIIPGCKVHLLLLIDKNLGFGSYRRLGACFPAAGTSIRYPERRLKRGCCNCHPERTAQGASVAPEILCSVELTLRLPELQSH
ncbi:hypothetical protein XENORESO_010305 [Xenotaenia resolanae]|uniref:Ribosomal protein S14 n=1 Tax=Xenotaenia resolanae TaxID=208358 RepID=A0ABV0W5T5_9TELE